MAVISAVAMLYMYAISAACSSEVEVVIGVEIAFYNTPRGLEYASMWMRCTCQILSSLAGRIRSLFT